MVGEELTPTRVLGGGLILAGILLHGWAGRVGVKRPRSKTRSEAPIIRIIGSCQSEKTTVFLGFHRCGDGEMLPAELIALAQL